MELLDFVHDAITNPVIRNNVVAIGRSFFIRLFFLWLVCLAVKVIFIFNCAEFLCMRGPVCLGVYLFVINLAKK